MIGSKNRRLRLQLLAFAFVVAGIAMVVRVGYIQIARSEHYQQEARDEHFGQQEIRAPRGAILDRNGYPLATTQEAFDVFIERKAWDNIFDARKAADAIAPLINVPPDQLVADVRRSEDMLYLAYAGLDYDKGTTLAEVDAPGLRVVQTTHRFYPEGDIASTLLGFVGRDHVGLSGIEADYDRELGGVPGTLYFERDSTGKQIALGRERIGKEPRPGGNVTLTIDRYIQRLVEGELEARIQANGALGGSIIVMDPRTGELLAMASRPGFRLSQLDLNDPDHSMFRNRAVTDVYEPGSVFKLLTAAMAVDMGKVTPESTYYDEGAVFIGESTIRNWDFSKNGTVSVTQLLQRSLNTGAVWLSRQVGEDAFYQYMRSFGIGESTHVGLSGDDPGLLRSQEDPAWSPVDLATNSFGQGVAASPLQVITAIASLVNGGQLMRPYVVREADTPEGPRKFEPVVVRQVVKPETAATMADMMNRVVEGIPGNLAAVEGYHVGGKTGTTTEATLADGAVTNGNVASFVGFAPVDDPQFIMLIKLDFREDRLGGQVSAPVFAALAPRILAYLGVQPGGPQLVNTGR